MRYIITLFLIVLFSPAVFAQKTKAAAENFTAVAIDKTKIELAELKGKVVLITFWSTRCPICAAEIPKLNEMAAKYKDEDIVFLGLTTDGEETIKAYLKKKPFVFKLIPDSFGTLLKYADKDKNGNVAMGYPAHFLIDQKGEIVLKTSGFDKSETLDARINQLLTAK